MAYEVTIGIPVYNAGEHLHDTMVTALAQDYPSIEYLILDDCGTDASIDIIHQLQQNHSRGKDIRIVKQEFNKGIGAARNRILKEAHGKFLYFLDADDLMVPTTISLMVSVAKKYHAEAVFASYERVELYHQASQKVLYKLPNKVFTKQHEIAIYAFSQYAPLQANIWNVLMDMEIIRKNHLQFVNTNYWEDMTFKYDFVTYLTRVVLLPDVTYSYMCRENSLSNFQSRDKIEKDEILRNVATMNILKCRYKKLLWRPYFSDWLKFIMDTDYYIIRDVLLKRDKIQPWISNVELRNILYSPLSVAQTLRHGNVRCCLYKLLSLLPPNLFVGSIKLFTKVLYHPLITNIIKKIPIK